MTLTNYKTHELIIFNPTKTGSHNARIIYGFSLRKSK